jgi:uncharacterized membrane protein/thiol-disulfide isomerase/thioredoxin
MKQKYLLGLLSTFVWLLGIQISSAQAQPPVVYAALFFSPSCGHCHYVITEILPPLQEEYGEQLQVLYIDVSQPAGRTLFQAACEGFDVSADRCGYVPTLVIGDTVLVGSGDIPDQMPDLVRDGVVAGGIDMPAIPGLREAYEASVSVQQASDTQDDPPESAPISTIYRETTWQDRLNQDPLGNGLAIGVLGILLIGLLVQLGYGTRLLTNGNRRWETGRIGWLVNRGLATMTTAIAGTLVLENSDFSLPTVLATGVTGGMIVAGWGIWQADRQSESTNDELLGWVIPVISLVGLVVASYLAYVEINGNEAVCGAVGDCNTVQQSKYARVFDLIPIGLLGVFGYVMILTAWLVSRRTDGWLADTAHALLLGFSVFGTALSIYLTFLEPFVIGATRAWCLTSAMLMILILCLQAPVGWAAIDRLVNKLVQWQHQRNQPSW